MSRQLGMIKLRWQALWILFTDIVQLLAQTNLKNKHSKPCKLSDIASHMLCCITLHRQVDSSVFFSFTELVQCTCSVICMSSAITPLRCQTNCFNPSWTRQVDQERIYSSSLRYFTALTSPRASTGISPCRLGSGNIEWYQGCFFSLAALAVNAHCEKWRETMWCT